MPRLLCKIIETFHFTDQGTVVVLDDLDNWRIPATEAIVIREAIRILRPDKSSVKTFIKNLGHIRRKASPANITIQLPNDVLAEHVPDGSLIFLEREDDKPILWNGLKAQFTAPSQ